VPGCSARAGHAHDEVTKGIIEFLDVREHAHGARGAEGAPGRPCSRAETVLLYESAQRCDSAKGALSELLSATGQKRSSGTSARISAKRTLEPSLYQRLLKCTGRGTNGHP
jgi:hypothetical protein